MGCACRTVESLTTTIFQTRRPHAGSGASLAALPRGGTLVKCVGVKQLPGLEKFEARMGRVVEMMERQFMDDGKTELCTVLLDSRSTDYDRSQGVWVAVPLPNLRIQ